MSILQLRNDLKTQKHKKKYVEEYKKNFLIVSL